MSSVDVVEEKKRERQGGVCYVGEGLAWNARIRWPAASSRVTMTCCIIYSSLQSVKIRIRSSIPR